MIIDKFLIDSFVKTTERAAIGTMAVSPMADPVPATDIANALRRVNQAPTIFATATGDASVKPVPVIRNKTYTCHSSCTDDIPASARPPMSTPVTATIFGSYLSASQPANGLSPPVTRPATARAPASDARLQSNSSVTGLRKTPKENRDPAPPNNISAAARTTIQP